jgi:vesicle coat complex subunit
MTEVNETIVSLCHARDIYRIEVDLIEKLIKEYDILARQIYCLSEAWDKFTFKGRKNRDDS